MSNFRHVAPAPALTSSTPDPSCTTDLVFRFQVGAGRDQGLGDFQAVLFRCVMKRGLADLSQKRGTRQSAPRRRIPYSVPLTSFFASTFAPAAMSIWAISAVLLYLADKWRGVSLS